MGSLSEKIYKELLRRIVGGELKPGSTVKEELLASELGVSRTPVREALARLERDGLIVRSGKSYQIVPLSRDDVIQLYEVRKPLEALAAELAAQRISEEVAARLKDLVRRVSEEAAKEAPDPIVLAELNGSIHMEIARASGNKYLVEFIDRVRLKLLIVRISIFTSYERRLEEVREHSEIVEAVLRRDPKLAREAMERHMDRVVAYVRGKILPLLFP